MRSKDSSSGLSSPVSGMYGGFSIELRSGYLEVSSWSRVVGGSGQTHVTTREGYTLVAEGSSEPGPAEQRCGVRVPYRTSTAVTFSQSTYSKRWN